MKMLITGAEGYIGSHLCKLLRQKNISYVPYDIKSGRDITNRKQLEDVVMAEKPTMVAHLAALSNIPECEADLKKCKEINTEGTANILNVMTQYDIPRLVFASSAAVYANSDTVLTETSELGPMNNYGRSKLAAERLVLNSDVDFTILRIFNAAGADPELEIGEDRENETHIIPLAIKAAIKGTTLNIYGDGNNKRDFVHVSDVAAAFLKNGKGIFNIGSGESVSVLQVVDKIKEIYGKDIKLEFKQARSNEPGMLKADILKASEELGWQPNLSGLESIINTAYGWATKLEKAK